MATWQIGYRLVPANALLSMFGNVPASISLEQYEGCSWWLEFDQVEEFVERLDALLPRRSSWAEELMAWGADDGNRVDVWFEDTKIFEVTARIDARDPHKFATVLASIAASFDLLGVTDDYKVHTLDNQQILLDVANSAAAKFVADPETFLTGVDQKHHLNLE